MNKTPKVPKLFVWENYGLYLGTNQIPLSTYSVTSDQLLLVIEGEILKKKDSGDMVAIRSVLIRAGATINMSTVDASTAVIAIFYLDPLGSELRYLQTRMQRSTDEFYYHHGNEDELIATCLRLRDNVYSIEEVEQEFQALLIPPCDRPVSAPNVDPRAVKVMHYIRATITENLTIQDYAEHVHMSDSRLRKLFKNEFNVPITRYRLGYRIITGILYLAVGATVTEAALAAGFASTAHFSKCFRAVTGIHLTAMFLKPPFLDVYIDKAVATPKIYEVA